jgi:outer membrane protein OmpA-like peptidoglycan-associated protein
VGARLGAPWGEQERVVPSADQQAGTGRLRRILEPVIGFVVVAVLGLGLFLVLDGGDGDDQDAAGPTVTMPSTTTTAGGEASTTTVAQVGTTAAPTTTTSTTAATTTTARPTTTTTTAPPPTTTTAAPAGEVAVAPPPGAVAAERYAVLKGGKVYLLGRVPSQDVADTIVAKATAVMGEGNVVNQYQVDPASTLPSSAPLYVADYVLYAYDSAELAPDFRPLLDLGVLLLRQNPAVTITVNGHTDDRGSAEYNLDLSQRRVQSVLDYWAAAGVDTSRVRGVAKGESEPIAPNDTDEGRAVNRRTEFVIDGILN